MHTFSRFTRIPRFAAATCAVVVLLVATVGAVQSDLLAQPESTPIVRTSDTRAVAGAADDSTDVYVIVEEMPRLIGGLESVQQSLVYPEIAKRAGVEGKVFVQFVVDTLGNVINPLVTRGIGAGCDEAALEAVKQMRFEPGRQGGAPVKVKMSVPITFRLPDGEGGSTTVTRRHPIDSRPTDETLQSIRDLRKRYADDPALTPDQRRTALEVIDEMERDLLMRREARDPKALGVATVRWSGDELSGQVVDGHGNPVAGVNVLIEGTEQGAVSDFEGRFTLRSDKVGTGGFALRFTHPSHTELRLPMASVPTDEPREFELLGAYPNPFNPATAVIFNLPAQADVTFEVFDIVGRRVHQEELNTLSAGRQITTFDGSDLASGAYLFRITARWGGRTRTLDGQFTLLK